MSATTSLQFQKSAWDGYMSGKTFKAALQDGTSVALSVENDFINDLAADDASGVAHASLPSVPTTQIDTVASPKRVELHVPDVTFTAVAAVSKSCAATISDNLFTCTNHGFSDHDTVVLSDIDGLTGVTAGTTYYVVNAASGTFKLATTRGGGAIDLTGADDTVTVTHQICRIYYYLAAGTPATSPVIHHVDLASVVTPNGGDIVVRQGADGVVHAEMAVA